jgi:MoxR-like ATPase
MLDAHGSASPLETLAPVARAADIAELIATVRTVHVAEPLKQYVVSLVTATRAAPELRLGASPRATLHLLRASRAWAALDGRDFVIPDDVQALALPVLAHRLLPSTEAMVTRQSPEQVLAALVSSVPLPQLR